MNATVIDRQSIEARDAGADTARMRARIEAYRDRLPSPEPRLIVDTAAASTAQGGGGIPELEAAELDATTLKANVLQHGSALVRGLFPVDVISALPAAIDEVLAAIDLPREEKRSLASHYYSPPDNLASIMPEGAMELGALRVFNTEVGAAMCVEAPSVAEALLQVFDALKLKQLVGEYLGEPPCLSVKKWVLRRSALPVDEAGWHQDGAFMGTDINTLNLWLPLTECGGETGAPGMDIVPQRLYGIASAEGASFDWSVADEQVNREFADNAPVAPVFYPGDAFFFDHLLLHRTQFREDFVRPRYAVESWFFGASSFPKSQVPLAW